MSEKTLRERVDEQIATALTQIDRIGAAPGLADLRRELTQGRERLRQPMRVAIVGLIKAGKSTMMNALLGEAVVAMGTVEATFNVNWLKYGDPPALRVHYKDGRAPEAKPFGELDALTRRAAERQEQLRNIKYLEVIYPNAMLRELNLIDTPGLESVHEDDSANTRDFIKLHGAELSDVTRTEASNADAVLYLFSQSVATQDQSVIEQFQGPGLDQVTPINSIGVLTKVDTYWGDSLEPVATGRRIAERLYADHPQVRRLFYTISPVCGLLALGAQALTPQDTAALVALAALPEERFTRLIQDAERFAESTAPDIPVPPAARVQVLDRLGQFGVAAACGLIRQGMRGHEQLAHALLERSGLPALRTLLLAHFGNRAVLIKLDTVLRKIGAVCFWAGRQLQGTEQEAARAIGGQFEALRAQEHGFRELRVLRAYYEGNLPLIASEARQLLEVTGEYGGSCAARLGMAGNGPIERTLEEMHQVAGERMRAWRARAADPLAGREVIDAAEVLDRSYERIAYHLAEASKHLYLAQ
jgi:hypothetical protein